MVNILVIMAMKLVMHNLIIIYMMNYWIYIFKIKMIYRRMKEATTPTINTITSLMMITLTTFQRKLLIQTYLLMIKIILVTIGGI